jgi:hypothetical protein
VALPRRGNSNAVTISVQTLITLQFSAQNDLGSLIIELGGAGPFSHVDLVEADGRLYGARSDAVGGVPPGVQSRPPDYEKFARRVRMSFSSTPAEEKTFWDFAYAQRGKPYDTTAILAFVANRDWRTPDAWFCSELATASLETAAICPPLYSPVNKIEPVTLAIVCSALGEIVTS